MWDGEEGSCRGGAVFFAKKFTGTNQCFENLRGHSLELKDINCGKWLHRAQGAKSFSWRGAEFLPQTPLKLWGGDRDG